MCSTYHWVDLFPVNENRLWLLNPSQLILRSGLTHSLSRSPNARDHTSTPLLSSIRCPGSHLHTSPELTQRLTLQIEESCGIIISLKVLSKWPLCIWTVWLVTQGRRGCSLSSHAWHSVFIFPRIAAPDSSVPTLSKHHPFKLKVNTLCVANV